MPEPSRNASNQSLYMSAGEMGGQSSSIHDLSYKIKDGNNSATERLKFVGKHGKDKVLSIYVQKRTIIEYEKDHKVENILGVLKVSQIQADRILERDQG